MDDKNLGRVAFEDGVSEMIKPACCPQGGVFSHVPVEINWRTHKENEK